MIYWYDRILSLDTQYAARTLARGADPWRTYVDLRAWLDDVQRYLLVCTTQEAGDACDTE